MFWTLWPIVDVRLINQLVTHTYSKRELFGYQNTTLLQARCASCLPTRSVKPQQKRKHKLQPWSMTNWSHWFSNIANIHALSILSSLTSATCYHMNQQINTRSSIAAVVDFQSTCKFYQSMCLVAASGFRSVFNSIPFNFAIRVRKIISRFKSYMKTSSNKTAYLCTSEQ